MAVFLPGWGAKCFSQDTPPVFDEIDIETESPKNKYFTAKVPGEQVYERDVADSVRERLSLDPAFWYADSLVDLSGSKPSAVDKTVTGGPVTKEKPNKKISRQSWFQTILWILIIGGFMAFLIVYLQNSNVRLFRKRSINMKDEGEEVLSEDIFKINYQREIDRAAGQGNYRLATRLMYLRLLKDLSERNIIQYKPDRTNLDYLSQLASTTYYNEFFRITRNYEYAWYGKFEVNKEAYSIIKKEMDRFSNYS